MLILNTIPAGGKKSLKVGRGQQKKLKDLDA